MKRLNTLLFIALSAAVVSCFNPTDFEVENLNVKEVIRLWDDGQSHQILADGSSTYQITASLSGESVDGKRTVEFTTTRGSFVGGEGSTISKVATPSDTSNRYEATVTLVSTSSTGTARVTAIAGGVKAEETVQVSFTRALPEALVVRVDSASLRPSFQNEMVIRAILLRSSGTPTANHSVSFTVLGEDDREVGFYVNNIRSSSSDGSGVASIRYTIGSDAVATNEVLRAIATTQLVQGSDTIMSSSQTQFVVDN